MQRRRFRRNCEPLLRLGLSKNVLFLLSSMGHDTRLGMAAYCRSNLIILSYGVIADILPSLGSELSKLMCSFDSSANRQKSGEIRQAEAEIGKGYHLLIARESQYNYLTVVKDELYLVQYTSMILLRRVNTSLSYSWPIRKYCPILGKQLCWSVPACAICYVKTISVDKYE